MDAGRFARPFRVHHGVLPFVLALAIAGCSTTDYAKPVNDFAAATRDAKTTLSELNVQVTQAYRTYLDNSIARGDVLLTPAEGDCEVQSEHCRLVLLDKEGKNVGSYPPEPPLTNISLLMAEIDSYAGNLKALLEADTKAKVEANVNAALGSIQKLATTVAEMQAPEGQAPEPIPQFATPVGEGVNWLLGQYIERIKFKGLQRATAAAKQVIRDAAGLFDKAASLAAAPRVEMANEVSQAQDTAQDNRDAASNDAFARSAAKFDALLATGPPEMFQRMAAAHDALAENLQGENVSMATVFARIEEFGEQAEQLAKILRDLRALSEQPEG